MGNSVVLSDSTYESTTREEDRCVCEFGTCLNEVGSGETLNIIIFTIKLAEFPNLPAVAQKI